LDRLVYVIYQVVIAGEIYGEKLSPRHRKEGLKRKKKRSKKELP
jgi:hypothetical protein